MDWSDEPYVKLFIRESLDEQRMGWQAWALFQKVLRISDYAGLLPHEGDDDIPLLARKTMIPEDVIRQALPRLLAQGSVTQGEGHLVVTNKQDAQETAMSDKLRKQQSRRRRREKVTNGDDASQNVTDGHDSSHDVTRGHTESRAVTQSRAEQSRAEQSRAEQSRAEQTPTGGVSAGAYGKRNAKHAGEQLGAEVTRWLNERLKKKFDQHGKLVREAGSRWRKAKWQAPLVKHAVDLRIEDLKRTGNDHRLVIPTLYNGKLENYVAMAQQGVTVERMRQDNGHNNHDSKPAPYRGKDL